MISNPPERLADSPPHLAENTIFRQKYILKNTIFLENYIIDLKYKDLWVKITDLTTI